MKLYESLDSGRRILEGNGVPDPDVDAELLWQYVSGMNKLDIIMNRGEDIPSDIAVFTYICNSTIHDASSIYR